MTELIRFVKIDKQFVPIEKITFEILDDKTETNGVFGKTLVAYYDSKKVDLGQVQHIPQLENIIADWINNNLVLIPITN